MFGENFLTYKNFLTNSYFQEALFVMTRATECFVEKVVRAAFDQSALDSLDYAQLADYVQDNDELEFLHGAVQIGEKCLFFLFQK